jgi:adenylate cyclase
MWSRRTTATDKGEQYLKNIARPVRAYSMSAAAVASLLPMSSAAETVKSVTSTTAPQLSIVVLPFQNLSNDPEQEYFADGLTDDLTTDLSRISGSFVIARNTAFTYKARPVDVKQIGEELGVRYVIEGSVRRAGGRVCVNVQLIDAQTGAHVWADRFDTALANLAEAHDEITGRLARTFDLELAAAADRGIEVEKAVDPNAEAFVLRGRAWFYRPPSVQTRKEAQRAFERALAIDPQSIDAMVGLAATLVSNLLDGWSRSFQQDQARAEQLLSEALERDSNMSKAHFAMGCLRRSQGALTEARIEFETAIALNRNDVGAFFQLGLTLIFLGEPEAAISHIEKAIRLSPRDPYLATFLVALGAGRLLLGDVDQAIDLLRRARVRNPRYWYVHVWLAGALGLKGNLDEARAVIADGVGLKPEVRSLVQYGTQVPWETNPEYLALRAKTLDVGLRRAGFPTNDRYSSSRRDPRRRYGRLLAPDRAGRGWYSPSLQIDTVRAV